jgi:MmyB-like transcription regulator ligand binding domain
LPSPGLRRFISIGTDVEDPRIVRLVGEMSLASEPFRRLWARHDVRALAGAPARMCHPQAGMLELRREKLPTGDSGGQLLVIYHAEPDSASGRSLALRGSLASTGEAAAEAGGAREPRTSARGSFAP